MGSSSKQSTHSVTTPTNPAWVDKGLESLGGKISDLSNLDPYSLVAGSNPFIQAAGDRAAALGQSDIMGQTGANIAVGVANANAPHAQAGSLLDNLQGYMSPYTNDVVKTSLADFDQNAGQTRAQQALDMAGSGAFGGSGAAITRSLTEDSLARARAALDANLRDQGFSRGASLSSEDASRRQAASIADAQFQGDQMARQLQAAGLLGDMGNARADNARADVGALLGVGDVQHQIEQAQKGAPISLLGTQAGLFGSLPLDLLHGQVTDETTKKTSSNPLGALGSLAMLAAAPFTGGTSLLGGLGGLFGRAAAGGSGFGAAARIGA